MHPLHLMYLPQEQNAVLQAYLIHPSDSGLERAGQVWLSPPSFLSVALLQLRGGEGCARRGAGPEHRLGSVQDPAAHPLPGLVPAL